MLWAVIGTTYLLVCLAGWLAPCLHFATPFFLHPSPQATTNHLGNLKPLAFFSFSLNYFQGPVTTLSTWSKVLLNDFRNLSLFWRPSCTGFLPKAKFLQDCAPSHTKCCIHCHCPENLKHHETIFISVTVYSPVQWWKSCIWLQGHDCPNLNTAAHSKGWCCGVWGLTIGSGCQIWPCAHCGRGWQGPHTCHMYP
jgi:hypothetical protein